MTPTEQVGPKRVSILARLIPLSSYGLPALGAAVSAWLFLGVMQAMRNAEAAGIAAVAGGMSEANLAIIVTFYLAIFVGFAGIISFGDVLTCRGEPDSCGGQPIAQSRLAGKLMRHLTIVCQ